MSVKVALVVVALGVRHLPLFDVSPLAYVKSLVKLAQRAGHRFQKASVFFASSTCTSQDTFKNLVYELLVVRAGKGRRTLLRRVARVDD